MGTINMDIATRISKNRQWDIRRVDNEDGSTTYFCENCGEVIAHDEAGTIRLGILPHVEGEEDDIQAARCKARK